MGDSDMGLLARWSQRRQKVEAENVAEELAAEQADELAVIETTEPSQQTITPVEDEESETVLTAEDLPDPEQIEVGGSFADFMGSNVDPQAKTDALRALWKQPHFNEVDGLVEYGLDYTNQPKLSAKVSAELAQKVFRHILKSEDDENEDETLVASKADVQADNIDVLDKSCDDGLANAEQSIEGVTQDNLAGVTQVLPQNEPEPSKA